MSIDNYEAGGKTRLGIGFFYDEDGIIDEYYFHLLEQMSRFTSRNICVSNGPIQPAAFERLSAMGYEIIIRDNIGFDVWAYKTAIEYVGYDHLGEFDEIMLYNHTFYGPIYPFEEMFGAMDAQSCDFWGITAHKEMDPNPFTNEGILPWHLNSHFIAVRRNMAISNDFRRYWIEMPMITSYVESVLTHESRFSEHFRDLGYACSVYDDDNRYSSKYPCFIEVDESLKNRCPILKRRIFFHEPLMHELNAIDLPHALRIMRETSTYDESMIWRNIIRTADLRTLNTVAAQTTTLPDVRVSTAKRSNVTRLAVCAHIYYTDMTEELLDLTRNISQPFDFIATTDTAQKAKEIEEISKAFPNIENVEVRVMETNRGRDMSSLFITCRDLFLEDRYDLVCRLHSKKSPQVDSARSNIFKRHMFENLLNSKGYVENVLDLFEAQPWLGVAVPPAVHISYHTLGLGWFANKPRAIEEAKHLGLKVKFDDHTPVAAYGTMFWFRPAALRKLFEREWQWGEFNAEPHHVDGGLAHAVERLITYTAQDAGYTTQHIASNNQMSYNYTMLEFKYSELSANLPFNFSHQVWMTKQWSSTGHQLPATAGHNGMRDGYGFRAAWYEDRNLVTPLPWEKASSNLLPAEKRKAWHHALGKQISLARLHERHDTLDHDFNIIRQYIALFDSSFWLGDNSTSIEDRIREYLLFGWAVGNDIFTLFDTLFYIESNPDVATSPFNPFVHYIVHGAQEGRQPHILFDPVYYIRGRGADSTAVKNPLLDFARAKEGRMTSPHPLFDTHFYYAVNPDVAERNENALSHYLRYGGKERRRPHALFDQDFYEAGIGIPLGESVNPLIHYLTVGAKQGVDSHSLFDSRYYRESLRSPLGNEEALTHYLSASPSERGQPHPLFDEAWYRKETGLDGNASALEHYLSAGYDENRKPHAMFDGDAYLKLYPDVRKAGMNPLVHFVKYGAWEGRSVPGFDDALYLRENKLRRSDIIHPFAHYLKYDYYKLLQSKRAG